MKENEHPHILPSGKRRYAKFTLNYEGHCDRFAVFTAFWRWRTFLCWYALYLGIALVAAMLPHAVAIGAICKRGAFISRGELRGSRFMSTHAPMRYAEILLYVRAALFYSRYFQNIDVLLLLKLQKRLQLIWHKSSTKHWTTKNDIKTTPCTWITPMAQVAILPKEIGESIERRWLQNATWHLTIILSQPRLFTK